MCEDAVLKARFSLGPFSHDALEGLELNGTAWAAARLGARRASPGGSEALDPSAGAVLSWVAWAAGPWPRRGGAVGPRPGPAAVLWPIFADHDRSSHAERWALLAAILALVGPAEGWQRVLCCLAHREMRCATHPHLAVMRPQLYVSQPSA